MPWTEAYATGIPQLDEQHRTLFLAVDELRTAAGSGDGATAYQRMLRFLEHYCREHFGLEEQCMAAHRCPSAEVNKTQHRGLLQMLAQYRRLHDDHGYDSHDAELLVHALDHWLHNHLGRVDRQLWHCVQRKPAGGEA